MKVVEQIGSFLRRAMQSPRLSNAQPQLQPTVEWQVNGHCNYDCFYCIQSRASRVGTPSSATIHAIVRGLQGLPGIWEIKMSGGEPFAFKGFIDQVIPELMAETPHHVSVLTNFSAPLSVLERFAQLTAERLRITSASLHPDSVPVNEFVAKAVQYREFRQRWNPHSSFVVNVVLVPGRIERHINIRDQLLSHGLRYFPQLMKIHGGVYPYDEHDRNLIEELTSGSHDPTDVNRAPSYRGLFCHAGAWYFIVDQTGEAYTCQTGKRFAEKTKTESKHEGANEPISLVENWQEPFPANDAVSATRSEDDVTERGRLGSFVRGDFRLRAQGGRCPYPICPCTVPVNRGIVELPLGRKVAAGEQLGGTQRSDRPSRAGGSENSVRRTREGLES